MCDECCAESATKEGQVSASPRGYSKLAVRWNDDHTSRLSGGGRRRAVVQKGRRGRKTGCRCPRRVFFTRMTRTVLPAELGSRSSTTGKGRYFAALVGLACSFRDARRHFSWQKDHQSWKVPGSGGLVDLGFFFFNLGWGHHGRCHEDCPRASQWDQRQTRRGSGAKKRQELERQVDRRFADFV